MFLTQGEQTACSTDSLQHRQLAAKTAQPACNTDSTASLQHRQHSQLATQTAQPACSTDSLQHRQHSQLAAQTACSTDSLQHSQLAAQPDCSTGRLTDNTLLYRSYCYRDNKYSTIFTVQTLQKTNMKNDNNKIISIIKTLQKTISKQQQLARQHFRKPYKPMLYTGITNIARPSNAPNVQNTYTIQSA